MIIITEIVTYLVTIDNRYIRHPFVKEKNCQFSFVCQYEYVMMEWLFGVSAQSLTAVRQRRPPQGQK